MKWIGQHIYDLVSRFRNKVYIEDDLSITGSITSTDDLAIIATGNDVTIDTDNITATSAASAKPSLELENTHSNNRSSVISFHKNHGAGVDDETLGAIRFKGYNDAGTPEPFNYAIVEGKVADMTNGQEAGKLEFGVLSYDGTSEVGLTIDGDTNADGEVDVTIANGAASTTTVAGNLVVTSDLTVNGDNVTFESGNADDPTVTIKNTANDNQAARLLFLKDRGAAMADNDRIAEIEFFGEDASQNSECYGKLMCQAIETDHGSETGKIRMQVAEYDGTLTDGLQLLGGDADGVVNVTLGAEAASTTTVAGDLAITTGLILDGNDVTGIDDSGEFTDDDAHIMTSAAVEDRINTKYSTSYITFSIKTYGTHGTNYLLMHGNGISGGLVSIDSGVDSATDFGGVTTEEGGSGTDATCDIATSNLEQQIPIPETCKLMGFYATTSTTSANTAGYDTGVAIWHVPEANVNWGGSSAGEATLIHKSDSSRSAMSGEGTNRAKVQKVTRMDGTAKTLAAGDILIPSLFGETADQQIMATITLVIATPIKTI